MTAALPTDPSRPLLDVRELYVSLATRHGTVRPLIGVSLSIDPGQILGVIGESGSGKSMTARAVLGLLPERISRTEGSIQFAGQQLVGRTDRQMRRVRGRDIALVLQDPMRSLDPTMRVGTQVVEAIRVHDRRVSSAAARARTLELLRAVQLADPQRCARSFPHELSGGMAQRVTIAQALAGQPKLLVADEPTTALDVTTQAQILALLVSLRDRLGMAIMLITHDMGIAAQHADQVAVMYAGRVVERAPARALFDRPRMPYTRALLDAIPSLRGARGTLRAIQGSPPDLLQRPAGCSFQPRCRQAHPRCLTDPPPLTRAPDTHDYACWFPLTDEPSDAH